jgi:hypothetical protein
MNLLAIENKQEQDEQALFKPKAKSESQANQVV